MPAQDSEDGDCEYHSHSGGEKQEAQLETAPLLCRDQEHRAIATNLLLAYQHLACSGEITRFEDAVR